ncbi:hypothetical protein GCM10010124_14010 [Pilimelia terevasa]|uniref:Peptidase M16 C-terminal domain-containing protein n=1 Tax=Pilimelia terevasa TaxID=53372 RepID=A0A8J3BL93_9ACTN|nr:insulinase family protein [Pilimelia terevasa]GGK22684.1 hypothetical protein GCM10010124_14010 [Pilimelia terevasa]
MTAAARPGAARIVDLPAGHRDDPPGRAGLAGLAARVLTSPANGGAAARAAALGWHTRHRLSARCSSFAFWSSDPADLDDILGDLRSARLPDGDAGLAVLDALRARQAAASGGRLDTPLARVGRVLERAAWGTPEEDVLGSAATLAAVTAADLRHALDDLTARAWVHDEAAVPGPPAAASPAAAAAEPVAGRGWSGGLAVADHPGSDARVAVRLAVADPAPDLLDVLVEVLGNGPDGRLHRELRHRHALAYGFTATCWAEDRTASIGATATVAAENAAAAVRVLATTLRGLAGGVPRSEWDVARWRSRAGLLAALDGPFGLVDEARRRAHGERLVAERCAAVSLLTDPPPLCLAPDPPAVAAVGVFDPRHRRQLADAYQEIR